MMKKIFGVFLVLLVLSSCMLHLSCNKSSDNTSDKVIETIIPPMKPKKPVPHSVPPPPTPVGVIIETPAYYWTYGCTPTAAGMLFGYYDRKAYVNFYVDAVAPLNNSSWPRTDTGQMPMIASSPYAYDHWVALGQKGNDPCPDCHPDDCIADFMGTGIDKYGNSDGSTTLYSIGGGSPLYDYTSCELISRRDACHGMRLFAEYAGYSVKTNYTQRIAGYPGVLVGMGYILDQYKASIDKGVPVLLQLGGHTVIGVGYNNSTVYIHDTWDYSLHSMTWGGSYSGMVQWGVTVFELN